MSWQLPHQPSNRGAYRHVEGLENARAIFDNAKPAPDSHLFFSHWSVRARGLRIDDGRTLLIAPMRDASRDLRNLAYINILGKVHHFLVGDISGQYFGLTGKKEVIAIADGLLAGARYHEATGNSVAIAFTSENISSVAISMQAKYPLAQIVLDLTTPTRLGASLAGVEAIAAITERPAPLHEASVEGVLALGSDAAMLLDWMQRKGLSEITKKRVMQFGPKCVRNAASAVSALISLVLYGFLTELDGRYHVTQQHDAD